MLLKMSLKELTEPVSETKVIPLDFFPIPLVTNVDVQDTVQTAEGISRTAPLANNRRH